MLENIFGKAVETALTLMHFGHVACGGTVKTKGANGQMFVFMLDDTDEAVERDANPNMQYADDAQASIKKDD